MIMGRLLNGWKVIVCLLICQTCVWMGCEAQERVGYPSKEGEIDIVANFANPPRGYGNVPFYWWNGDSLNKERLSEQLDELEGASTDGFAISYIHTHPEVDRRLNAKGYGSFGRADGGEPGVFTPEWWQMYDWFAGECAERGMGVGVDDYVIGWADNGYYVDELRADSGFANYQGRLKMDTHSVPPGGTIDVALPKRLVAVVAYPGGEDLQDCVKDGRLVWRSVADKERKVFVVHTEPSYELHPEYGRRLVDVYFNRFEERLSPQGRRGMNFFFQDELHYDLNIRSWCEDMLQEFQRRKGYDVRLLLPALFTDVGETARVRLDYAEVVTQLAEERYFKPVFDWHDERGLIYGSDNNGRGLNPVEYLDYFRMTSWFTAPGNDAPARGSSFRQTKVSSSVTHLYQRQRTWLEAFHSMGWDSNGEWMTSQLDHHVIAGGNLLCMHGLYYSTHGGWWEWAPPCFHFRMPYWPHMRHWLKYAERLCFLLSQGVHVCDIAVMYPTETLQAYPGSKIDTMWKLTDLLSTVGLDYDYIDYQSLQGAKIKDGRMMVADESYKVLILADVRAMHEETLRKVLEFERRGGMVIATGSLMADKDAVGEVVADYRNVPDKITGRLTPDFCTDKGEGRVLHRRIGERDVYMVMNVREGSEMFFRAKGGVECWDAKDGSMTEQPVVRQTEEGTWIRYDGDYNSSRLFVFSPGKPVYEEVRADESGAEDVIEMDEMWTVEVVPTMNNKWGDFRLPASDEIIGVEAREMDCRFVIDAENLDVAPNFDAGAFHTSVYGYAPYMLTKTLAPSEDVGQWLAQPMTEEGWEPYCYSWQYGVFDSPGSQGYHGLKGKVDNRFIILDKNGHQLFATQVYAPHDGEYYILREGVAPTHLLVDDVKVTERRMSLQAGWHKLLLVYTGTKERGYSLDNMVGNTVDRRQRSAVVFYPAPMPVLKQNNPYGSIVAMKWFDSPRLAYNPSGDEKGVWAYRFQTAPGARSLTLRVRGEICQLWVDGREQSVSQPRVENGVSSYECQLPDRDGGVADIVLTAKPECGNIGAAFFAEPVRIACGKGWMPVGDWSNHGALKFYSGGMRYSQTVNLPADARNKRVRIDLGKVDATCEVRVNGAAAGILMSPPYVLDITRFVQSGDNEVEVLVYSSLANHYQTVPSPYRGKPCAGLMGPVRVVRN